MDLREKYKHVTLEHLLTLDERGIEVLRRDIDRDHGKVVMYMENMQEVGGISKDVALQMRELLPPTMAMEGFTDRPSYNGYWMVEESLSTTAKVLVGVAVVAVFGSLLYWALKTAGKKTATLNAKTAEDEKKAREARVAWESNMAKMRANEAQAARDAEKARADSREQGIQRFVASKPNAYTMRYLEQLFYKGVEIGASLTQLIERANINTYKDYHEKLVPAIDEIIKFAKNPNGPITPGFMKSHATIGRVDHTEMAKLDHWCAEQFKELHYGSVGTNTVLGKKIDFETFMSWARGDNGFSVEMTRVVFDRMNKQPNKEVKSPTKLAEQYKMLNDISKIAQDLPKQEKRLEGVDADLPPDFKKGLTTLIEDIRDSVKYVDKLIDLINLEIATYTHVAQAVTAINVMEVKGIKIALEYIINDPNTDEKIREGIRESIKSLPRI